MRCAGARCQPATPGTPGREPRPCGALLPQSPGTRCRGGGRLWCPLTPLRPGPSPSLWGCRSRRARRGCGRCPSRRRSSPSGSAGPSCRSAGSGRSGPRVAPRCHPWRHRGKRPGAAPPCSAFPPSKAGDDWVAALGGNRRGLGSIRCGSREPNQAVAPSPRSLSVSRPPACLSVRVSPQARQLSADAAARFPAERSMSPRRSSGFTRRQNLASAGACASV